MKGDETLSQRSTKLWLQKTGRTGFHLMNALSTYFWYSTTKKTISEHMMVEKVPSSEQWNSVPIVCFWGDISISGLLELYIVPQGTTVHAQYYTNNILEKVLRPVLARRKKSGSVNKQKIFISCLCKMVLWASTFKEEWPPNSSDLNITEDCWGIVNSCIFTSASLITMKQLNSRAVQGR